MSVHPKLAKAETVAALPSAAVSGKVLRLPVRRNDTAANDAFCGAAQGRTQQGFKRALDVAVALAVFVAIAPLMAAIALLIRLDSAGPVLFRQKRLGLHGKPFTILKFRTMTVQENGPIVTQATKDDPRVTRVGRFLRVWSLDELPQLFNVLKGEMSLVGPRPHALAHDEFYAMQIHDYTLRQQVKPGITGWAQVHGRRGETPTVQSMRDRVDFDVWYAKHAGIALDIEIIFRTAFEVFRRRNAY